MAGVDPTDRRTSESGRSSGVMPAPWPRRCCCGSSLSSPCANRCKPGCTARRATITPPCKNGSTKHAASGKRCRRWSRITWHAPGAMRTCARTARPDRRGRADVRSSRNSRRGCHRQAGRDLRAPANAGRSADQDATPASCPCFRSFIGCKCASTWKDRRWPICRPCRLARTASPGRADHLGFRPALRRQPVSGPGTSITSLRDRLCPLSTARLQQAAAHRAGASSRLRQLSALAVAGTVLGLTGW